MELALAGNYPLTISERVSSYLTELGYNLNLVKQGFYPSIVESKKIEILDPVNEKKLKFKIKKRNHEFELENFFDYDGYVPSKIKENLKEDNLVFEEFVVAKPEESIDPFLFGKTNDKYYYIASWDTDEWKEASR